MTIPMRNIVGAGALVLSVASTGLVATPHAAAPPAGPSGPAALRSVDPGHTVANSTVSGVGTAPRDDGSDGDDGDDDDDGEG